MVDELVNLELYRRDFEFMPPSIPEEEEDAVNSGDEEQDETALDNEF